MYYILEIDHGVCVKVARPHRPVKCLSDYFCTIQYSVIFIQTLATFTHNFFKLVWGSPTNKKFLLIKLICMFLWWKLIGSKSVLKINGTSKTHQGNKFQGNKLKKSIKNTYFLRNIWFHLHWSAIRFFHIWKVFF